MSNATTRDHNGSVFELPRLLLRASLRNLGVLRIKAGRGLEVAVVSPGGVGTSMLIDHIGKYRRVNCNDDRDHLKHAPRLPKRLADELKVLFVHGDVDDIVRSIRRRGWIPRHGSKLGSIGSVLGLGEARPRALRRAVVRQIDWFKSHPHPNLLLIRYDELWDRTERLAEFLEISDPSFVAAFPPRRPRTSWSSEAPTAAANS